MYIFISHHKTGSVYSKTCLQNFCKETDYNFIRWHFKKLNFNKLIKNGNKFIFRVKSPKISHIEYLLNFYKENNLKKPKIIQFIRDPRSMIYSAAFYHKRNDYSFEKWRFENREEFNGKSYYEMINKLNDIELIKFEMKNASKKTIFEMLNIFNKFKPIIAKLEDFSHDESGITYIKLFNKLKLDSQYQDKFIESFRNNSLWYLNKYKKMPNHSETFVSNKFIDMFSLKEISTIYKYIYKNCHTELGYSNFN